jgi:putative SOS response-associated peptidase YedK
MTMDAETQKDVEHLLDDQLPKIRDACALMAEIHDRMPAILTQDDYDLWLDPEFKSKEKLVLLLRPYPADEMTAFPISTLVNSPKNDVAACIEASA